MEKSLAINDSNKLEREVNPVACLGINVLCLLIIPFSRPNLLSCRTNQFDCCFRLLPDGDDDDDGGFWTHEANQLYDMKGVFRPISIRTNSSTTAYVVGREAECQSYFWSNEQLSALWKKEKDLSLGKPDNYESGRFAVVMYWGEEHGFSRRVNDDRLLLRFCCKMEKKENGRTISSDYRFGNLKEGNILHALNVFFSLPLLFLLRPSTFHSIWSKPWRKRKKRRRWRYKEEYFSPFWTKNKSFSSFDDWCPSV